jgi:L-asparaginase
MTEYGQYSVHEEAKMIGQSTGEAVCVISTGGTFEKVYDPVSENMTFSGESCIPGILSECLNTTVSFRSMMQIDSRELTKDRRKEIVSYVANLECRKVVIVHGTSSIIETAKAFQNAKLDGVYVFTGAMTPFHYNQTEASFNIGGAIALCQCIQKGVYLFMHGEIFDPSRSRKDTTKGRFVHGAW